MLAATTAACGHQPAEPVKANPVPVPANLAASTTVSWSEQTRMPGEYLVTLVAGIDVKVISDVYGQFEIKSIKELGNGSFQIKLGNDPGPEKMEALRSQDSRIKAVQPNFIYRIDKPAGRAQ